MSTVQRPRKGNAPKDVQLFYDELPYRGPILNYKDSDPIEKQPQIGFESHVEIFDLSNDDDLAKYREAVQKLVSDQAVLSYEEKEYDPEKKNWKVLIVYSDIFYEAPKIEAEA